MPDLKKEIQLHDRASAHGAIGYLGVTKAVVMYHSVCGMVHIKDPLLLIEKSSPCIGGSGFPLSLSEWSFTMSGGRHITVNKMC